MPKHKAHKYECYEFKSSAWVQNLTQRELAQLLGTTKTQLEAIVRDKENFVRRKNVIINNKQRALAVPYGKLRTIHERLKHQLNKIKQPAYLFSPRKGRSQRDNAEHHVGQNQFLRIDIRQFYPSTSKEHVFRWAHHAAGLKSDVAGLFVHLATVDDKIPSGSPLSPILATHVHRCMFDAIYAICQASGLRMSLWVDDLVISGLSVPGSLIERIREIIRSSGLKSHKIEYRFGGRPVIVTGVPIIGQRVGAPVALHKRLQGCYTELRASKTDAQRHYVIERLLSHLGTVRYHAGAGSLEGRKAADRMNRLRLRRSQLSASFTTGRTLIQNGEIVDPSNLDNECPFDIAP